MNFRKLLISATILTSAISQGAWAGSEPSVLAPLRAQLFKTATVWEPTAEEKAGQPLDLFNGPNLPTRLSHLQPIDCDFVFDVFEGGYSPKFKCLMNGKKVKIKYYNGDNRELFGEIAAGRLLWALGFGADQSYLVQVNCRNCPSGDPWSWVDPRNGIIQQELAKGLTLEQIRKNHASEFVPLRKFAFATVEVKVKGEEIGEWGWNEIGRNNPSSVQWDALKLATALIQHADNAGKQNGLICKKENLVMSDKGEIAGCRQALAFIQDLGGTFGGGGPVIHHGGSTNFARWQQTNVWYNADRCEINLVPAGTPSRSQLNNVAISREGRDFLLARLQALAGQPGALESIFKAAGMDTGGPHPDGKSAADWAQLLRAKIVEIQSAKCERSATSSQ